MGGSIPLFRIWGIQILMHITFPLILIWGAIQFGVLQDGGVSGAIFGVVVMLLLFVIVVLHELGHSFAALYYGVPVKQIVLLPLGGVAQLENIPEDPKQEFVIAIAGPAVNFVLAIVLWLVTLLAGGATNLEFSAEALANPGLGNIFNYVFISNLFLGVFNLLPAFPMDGGRILRAFLATRTTYSRATAIAVAVGQGLAALMGMWGFLGGGFFIILVAIFVYLGAAQEGRAVQLRHVLGKLTVGQAYSRQTQSLSPAATLREAIDLTLSSFQADFPVCEGDRLLGLLTQARLLEALNKQGPDVPVVDVMLRDIVPAAPDDEVIVVQERMAESKIDALPVVADGLFLGLITSRDIGELFRLVSQQPDLIDKPF